MYVKVWIEESYFSYSDRKNFITTVRIDDKYATKLEIFKKFINFVNNDPGYADENISEIELSDGTFFDGKDLEYYSMSMDIDVEDPTPEI